MRFKSFYSCGKFLITGEYFILDGAIGLALPTIYGQKLSIISTSEYPNIIWKSFDFKSNIWFKAIFKLPSLDILYNNDKKTAYFLHKILISANNLKKNFFNKKIGFLIKTHLEFPKNWGLGSSSTLITNISKWLKIDPYKLLWNCFSGSGYDIACAIHQRPILYNIVNNEPKIIFIDFNPPFKNSLYFLYLNKKQDTNIAIEYYRNNIYSKKQINIISNLTKQIIYCESLYDFEKIILYHEKLISNFLKIPTIKEKYFPDYTGVIKSLGAWGGDFILVTFRKEMKNYFLSKGLNIIIPFNDIILK